MLMYRNLAQIAATLQELDISDLTQDNNFFDKGEFNAAKNTLITLKKIKQILDSLCTNVMAEVAALTARIVPAALYHGLEGIPDEVLARVLALDTYDSTSATRSEELRLVNRRFRNVVSSTPKCWSKVTSKTPRRNRFVNALVDLENAGWKTKEFMSYYQGRIRHLDLDTDYSIEDKDLENIDLSSVKSLVVRGEGVLLSMSHFPQLISLGCRYVPQPGAWQLIHCELDIPVIYNAYHNYDGYIGGYVLQQGVDYIELLRFLASMPSLQSLSIPVDTESCPDCSNSRIITLPNLKFLHIRSNCLSDNFLKALKCPNLKVMDVLLDKFHDGQDGGITKSSPTFKFHSVTSLTIRGNVDRRMSFDDGLCVELSDIHHIFPRIRSLMIDGEFVVNRELREGDRDLLLDDLQSITLCIPLQPFECYYRDEFTGLPYNDPSEECYDNWANLSSIFRWYKEKGARLKYLEVRERPREERKARLSVGELATLFPMARIQLDGRIPDGLKHGERDR